MSENCPLCNTPTEYNNHTTRDSSEIYCYRCGKYTITMEAIVTLPQYNKDLNKIAKISSWLFEHQYSTIKSDDIEHLINLPMPTIAEKANKYLLYMSKLHPIAGTQFKYNYDDIHFMLAAIYNLNPERSYVFDNEKAKELLPHLSCCWAIDRSEILYLLKDFLQIEKKYIEGVGRGDRGWLITPSGWDYIESQKYKNSESDTGLIAMWFNEKLNIFLDSVSQSISKAGYKPLRIDQHQHNNKIDDEIIAQIRKSKFLVADFTGQRGGVYFEAGFAMGLGLPVIWLCERDDLDKVHFDNRQYNFILWDKENLDELEKNLKIELKQQLGMDRSHDTV